jgi:hypothetical protein
MKTLGEIGYRAYSAFTGNKTYDGREMPAWENLTDKIRGAWEAAAQGIEEESSARFQEKIAKAIEDAKREASGVKG